MASACFSSVQFSPASSRSSPPAFAKRRRGTFSACYYPTRRLALVHLGAAVPQTVGDFGAPLRSLLKSDGNVAEAAALWGTALASEIAEEEDLADWVGKDKRRMLHAVYNVGDMDKTIKFYTECLGMKLLRRRDVPEDGYGNAFLGYGPEESNFSVELTYNYGVKKYDIGNGFGHFGVAVENVAKTVDLVKAKGGRVTREPRPLNEGVGVVAFVEDPDGYPFELLERSPTPEPFCRVMLRVGDLDRSLGFYEKAYGMELLRRKDYPDLKYSAALVGYGPEDKNPVVELTYNYGITDYDKGNGYTQIAIGTNDVYRTAKAIRKYGGKIVREPGPLPVLNTKITACLDPDGWKTAFVDNADFQKELE
uniref:lactoylglutathione lyase n=1 Tax=Kalanchoe fedtschenkoi TaxID=63787 RepID=A0A7N0V1H0_KALFE